MQTESVWRALPRKIRELLPEEELRDLQEIRLRSGQPLLLKTENRLFSLGKAGERLSVGDAAGIRISSADIREAVSLLSGYSLYAFEEELRQGYLTVAGGHRVGFCGKVVSENGEIRTMRQINALNIRIAREQRGWGEAFLPFLMEEDSFYHTLIVSPPGCGKTTLLRDLIRCLSERGKTVGVVDERGELAPLIDGVPQMEVGPCTDILEGCTKAKGMMLLLRSMSPEIIAVDELGSRADIAAAEEVLNAGVKLMATAHGRDFADMESRPGLRDLVRKKIFERYLFLSNRNGTGTVEEIRNRDGKRIRREEMP